jgi:hypothetical protein
MSATPIAVIGKKASDSNEFVLLGTEGEAAADGSFSGEVADTRAGRGEVDGSLA